jgi:UDP-N-acetylmuramoyl-L-alanyl-D-glutamate--2,6-diaminopimelate ligase
MLNDTTGTPLTENIISALTRFSITCPELLYLKGTYGDLVNDSRKVKSGDIFCAIIGHDQDGRRYIDKAISQGSKLIIAECESKEEHGKRDVTCGSKSVIVIKFYQLSANLFDLAKCYYQSPQDQMRLIGITGTNGKTSTSQLVATMLGANKQRCAVIGTNGAGMVNQLTPIENTTPGPTELHQFFNQFLADNISHVAMEVSSHALSQKRVSADLFDIAVFTNLSRDHLDYHGSMEEYALAKKQLFAMNSKQVSILNYDDHQSKIWLKEWPVNQAVWLYGREDALLAQQSSSKRGCSHSALSLPKLPQPEALKSDLSDSNFVSAQHISHHAKGVSFTLVTHLGDVAINSALLGDFNIDNLLAAICILLIEGVALENIESLVSQVKPIAGRMEAFMTKNGNLPTAVVDYAHTPDALEKALHACRQHCTGQLYVVFGCGGDRDKGKRALMARAAENNADYIMITNDNPRSENAESIANDILKGLIDPKSKKVKVLLDREQAVLATLAKAKQGDIVLLAGKGHEDYIIISDGKGGTRKIMYNERALVANFYQQSEIETTS